MLELQQEAHHFSSSCPEMKKKGKEGSQQDWPETGTLYNRSRNSSSGNESSKYRS